MTKINAILPMRSPCTVSGHWRRRPAALLLAALLTGGCQMNSTPVAPQSPTALSGLQVTGAALAGAAGAYGGSRLNNTWGAPAGALVAAGTVGLLEHISNTHEAQLVAEAYEKGRREAISVKLDSWWVQQQSQPLPHDGSKGMMEIKPTAYSAGVYQGVIYGPRLLSDPSNLDPVR